MKQKSCITSTQVSLERQSTQSFKSVIRHTDLKIVGASYLQYVGPRNYLSLLKTSAPSSL